MTGAHPCWLTADPDPFTSDGLDDTITPIFSVSINSDGRYCCISSSLRPPIVILPLSCLLGNRYNILSSINSKASSQDAAAALHEGFRIDKDVTAVSITAGFSLLSPACHRSGRDIWPSSCVSSVRSVVCERDGDTSAAVKWKRWWMTCQNGPRRLPRRLRWQAQGSRLTFSINRANRGSRWPQTWHMNIASVIAHLSMSDS